MRRIVHGSIPLYMHGEKKNDELSSSRATAHEIAEIEGERHNRVFHLLD